VCRAGLGRSPKAPTAISALAWSASAAAALRILAASVRCRVCASVALCDVDESVLAKGAKDFEKKNQKVETYTDVRKLLEKQRN